ncbi:MAG TPA: TRAP transporter fused permease subunit [Vicinamibacterales bacterium]|nr:TRAP transporter fused permease subunit [Vicinamibacterales bacterium]
METVNGAAAPVEDLAFESPTRDLRGRTATVAWFVSIAISGYALYWVIGVIQPQAYRITFLLLALTLSFLLYPRGRADRAGVAAADWLLIAVAAAALLWPLADFERFIYRAADPTLTDVALGAALIGVVLEATRRTAGPILPVTALLFVAYAFYGPLLDLVGLGFVAHRGYDPARIVGTLYMTLEGIFGVPLDVAATYIALFTIFGAVLSVSGTGAFLVEWALAAVGRSRHGAGAGRAVTLAGLLLGAVSGSGVANTVTLGAMTWPVLRKAGYPATTGAAILAAAGIGAIICPPALGAAAFIIAELLNIPYLQVVVMAIIPALLYFLGVLLMIEADTRRFGMRPLETAGPPLRELTRRHGYHFLPIAGLPIMLATGTSAFRAVFYAMLLAIGLSFFDRRHALWPRRLLEALATGGRSVVSVAATTATAGVIVGVVTLTGLGLKIAGLIVAFAGGSLFLTVLYSAIAVLVLGLAVPVTASYIIAAVMVAPAMTSVGVPDLAAHMFIFYYAVLSEVSPPTALSPMAAAAITGGRQVPTMWLAWKYTLPAFVFPFAFTLGPRGLALLMQGSLAQILIGSSVAALGVVALAAGLGGWIRGRASVAERVLAVAGGLLLFAPGSAAAAAGAASFAIAIVVHFLRRDAALPQP